LRSAIAVARFADSGCAELKYNSVSAEALSLAGNAV